MSKNPKNIPPYLRGDQRGGGPEVNRPDRQLPSDESWPINARPAEKPRPPLRR
jgi:hypothetical protein